MLTASESPLFGVLAYHFLGIHARPKWFFQNSAGWWRSPEGDMAGDGHLDTGASFHPAPNAELRADSLGPFPHPGQAPMSFPAGAQDLRIDATAIVGNDQPEMPVRVFDLDFNRSRA